MNRIDPHESVRRAEELRRRAEELARADNPLAARPATGDTCSGAPGARGRPGDEAAALRARDPHRHAPADRGTDRGPPGSHSPTDRARNRAAARAPDGGAPPPRLALAAGPPGRGARPAGARSRPGRRRLTGHLREPCRLRLHQRRAAAGRGEASGLGRDGTGAPEGHAREARGEGRMARATVHRTQGHPPRLRRRIATRPNRRGLRESRRLARESGLERRSREGACEARPRRSRGLARSDDRGPPAVHGRTRARGRSRGGDPRARPERSRDPLGASRRCVRSSRRPAEHASRRRGRKRRASSSGRWTRETVSSRKRQQRTAERPPDPPSSSSAKPTSKGSAPPSTRASRPRRRTGRIT